MIVQFKEAAQLSAEMLCDLQKQVISIANIRDTWYLAHPFHLTGITPPNKRRVGQSFMFGNVRLHIVAAEPKIKPDSSGIDWHYTASANVIEEPIMIGQPLGQCPQQIEGVVFGYPFYYRDRYGTVEFTVGCMQGMHALDGDPAFYVERDSPGAGNSHDAVKLCTELCLEFMATLQPCARCGSMRIPHGGADVMAGGVAHWHCRECIRSVYGNSEHVLYL